MIRSSQKKKMRTKNRKGNMILRQNAYGFKEWDWGRKTHFVTCCGKGEHEEKWKE